MVNRRFQSDEKASPALLAEPLHFKTSGRSARNRILKVSIWFFSYFNIVLFSVRSYWNYLNLRREWCQEVWSTH